MKRIAIAIIILAIAYAGMGLRVVRIELDPRIIDAYCKRYTKPRNLSRATWTDQRIRQQVRDVVRYVEERELRNAIVVDVNEVAR